MPACWCISLIDAMLYWVQYYAWFPFVLRVQGLHASPQTSWMIVVQKSAKDFKNGFLYVELYIIILCSYSPLPLPSLFSSLLILVPDILWTIPSLNYHVIYTPLSFLVVTPFRTLWLLSKSPLYFHILHIHINTKNIAKHMQVSKYNTAYKQMHKHKTHDHLNCFWGWIDSSFLLNKIPMGGDTEGKCGKETEGKAILRLPHL